jgi:hypothetical protein
MSLITVIIMLKQAIFVAGIIVLSIIAGTILVKNDILKDGLQSIHNQTTSVMCSDDTSNNKELGKDACTFICREKTACVGGGKIYTCMVNYICY